MRRLEMQSRGISYGTASVVLKPPLIVVRVTMDVFQHRYYKLTKTIMKLIGQWPYQNSNARRCFRVIIIYFNASEIATRIITVVKYHNNFAILLDCAVPIITDLICGLNFYVFMWNSQKTLKLLNRVRMDWQLWARHREINILHEYAEQGRKIITVCTAMVYFSVYVYVMQPFTRKIIDVLLKNGTEPGKYPHPIDYYNIDMQKNYFSIMIYFCVMVFMTMAVIIANNVMLVSYVVHVCGIFAALGHKLQRIGDKASPSERGKTPYALEKWVTANLAWCVERHDDAIEYTKLIESIYAWNIFFTLALGVTMINAVGLQILINISDPIMIIKFLGLALTLLILFFMNCYTAQILMDHSINIHLYIYNSHWYRISLNAKKLLILMMMRCTVPCQLTAGKIVILSVSTFGATFRAALSYFTIVRSMRTS